MRVTVNHSADIIHGLKAPRAVKNPFESERLVYRCYEPEDFETVLELHSNPQVYLNGQGTVPKPVTKKTIEEINKHVEDAMLNLIICKKAVENGTPEPMGRLILATNLPHAFHIRSIELGIELKIEAQGQGYGTEALQWALGWCFRNANFHRVQLSVFGWNLYAYNVYKRVGFVEEGRLRDALFYDGKYWDTIQMSILEEEWRAKYQAAD
jgi:RimJ/RimL family protein N-acetyltransferase